VVTRAQKSNVPDLVCIISSYPNRKKDQARIAAESELAAQNDGIAARHRMQEQNHRNAASNAAQQAPRSTASNGMRSTAEPTPPQESDLPRSLTPMQRNTYVSAVLNTEVRPIAMLFVC